MYNDIIYNNININKIKYRLSRNTDWNLTSGQACVSDETVYSLLMVTILVVISTLFFIFVKSKKAAYFSLLYMVASKECLGTFCNGLFNRQEVELTLTLCILQYVLALTASPFYVCTEHEMTDFTYSKFTMLHVL